MKTTRLTRNTKNARMIFERTGKRYNDQRGKARPLIGTPRKVYPRYTENHSLIKTFRHAWLTYTCPKCGWSISLRAKQGWPSHICA